MAKRSASVIGKYGALLILAAVVALVVVVVVTR
jgi:hypothetical protein